jgi:cytidine deaminase
MATAYAPGELPEAHQSLLAQAQAACQHAYAPYSQFWVGAAFRLEGGEVALGSNQENAAYPSGLCAERTAAYWLGANRPQARIEAVAVAARRADAERYLAITPCGACRQALLEYESRQGSPITVILDAGDGRSVVFPSVESLLPMKFSEQALKG